MDTPSHVPRPRRCAAERRAQRLRTEGRRVQGIVKALTALGNHRGCRRSKLGDALLDALAGKVDIKSTQATNTCRRFLTGSCAFGARCWFSHDANVVHAESGGGKDAIVDSADVSGDGAVARPDVDIAEVGVNPLGAVVPCVGTSYESDDVDDDVAKCVVGAQSYTVVSEAVVDSCDVGADGGEKDIGGGPVDDDVVHADVSRVSVSSWPPSASVGMPIRVWSHSQQKWFSDGYIEALNVDGSICVFYNGGETQKSMFWDDGVIEQVTVVSSMSSAVRPAFLDRPLSDMRCPAKIS